MNLPMALLASSAMTSGSNLLGGLLNKPEAMQQGYDIVSADTYPWAEGTQQAVNKYWMDMMQNMQAGQQPAWMQNTLDPMQQSAQQNLRGNVYGTGGRPGTLRDLMGAASITGVGPGAAMAKGSQHLVDYLTESDKIDQYFNQLKFGGMQQMATFAPQQAASMARGPEQQIVNYMGGGGQMNQQQPNYGAMAASIPWEQMFQPSRGVRGGVYPSQSQYSSFGGNYAGATPAGYTGTIQPF